MHEDARSFIEGANELPVMPPVAAEIMKKAEDPDSDLQSMAQLIARDASLAVRVLKIANSSFYSMPRKIETLQQAIVLLGYSTLRSVVVAASMKDVFARFGLAERLLWEHAVAAACAATVICNEVGGLASDEVFVGGLVHDVGKLVMHSVAENRYQEVMRSVYAGDQTAVEAEIEVFGFDHCEVGELVLEKWGLADRLAQAVGAHHDLSRAEGTEARPLAAVLQFSDQLCLREGMGRRKPDPELDPRESEAAAILGMQDVDLESLVTAFHEAYDSEKEIMG